MKVKNEIRYKMKCSNSFVHSGIKADLKVFIFLLHQRFATALAFCRARLSYLHSHDYMAFVTGAWHFCRQSPRASVLSPKNAVSHLSLIVPFGMLYSSVVPPSLYSIPSGLFFLAGRALGCGSCRWLFQFFYSCFVLAPAPLPPSCSYLSVSVSGHNRGPQHPPLS